MKHDDRFGKEVPVELKTGEIIAAYYHVVIEMLILIKKIFI